MEHNWQLSPQGYVTTTLQNPRRTMTLQRFLLNPPKNRWVDHIDRNKCNNTLDNLRIATYSQSNMNKRKIFNATSKYKGVSWHKRDNQWRAYIKINGKVRNIGYFRNERHAAIAYDLWAKELFGDFAKLNFT